MGITKHLIPNTFYIFVGKIHVYQSRVPDTRTPTNPTTSSVSREAWVRTTHPSANRHLPLCLRPLWRARVVLHRVPVSVAEILRTQRFHLVGVGSSSGRGGGGSDVGFAHFLHLLPLAAPVHESGAHALTLSDCGAKAQSVICPWNVR